MQILRRKDSWGVDVRQLVVSAGKTVRSCNPQETGRIKLSTLTPWFEIGVIDLMSILSRSLASLFVFSLPALASPSVQEINNFYQVDEHVYRGAQPTTEGFKYLAKISVKTVLDLREHDERSTGEEQVVTSLGMQYVNVPMTGLTPPTKAEITKILALLEDGTAGPVFVHCVRGADRTGVVIAAYRIDHDHWDNSRALKEAMSYGMSIFQFPRQSYILNFQPLTIKRDPKSSMAFPTEGNSNSLATASSTVSSLLN
jgi:tyrosine-protein phosphatase SIW14